MMSAKNVGCNGFASATDVVGDAVGLNKSVWFVAVVNHNSEKSVQERLARLGFESYVAKQEELRIWKNGRKTKVDKVVIPARVFVKCTEKERRQIVAMPFINRFMTDRASYSATRASGHVAVIPQGQIDTLRFMLGQSDIPISFVDTPLSVSDKVMVARGTLKGVEGEVIRVIDGKSDVVVRIGMLGSAKMIIDTVDLELLN